MSYLKTAILLAGLTGLFMGVGYLIGGAAGADRLLIAAATNMFGYWNSDRMVLRCTAPEVDERNAPDLYTRGRACRPRRPADAERVRDRRAAAQRLCHRPQSAERRGRRDTGLLQSLSREEVAGVMAHELAHIKNHDTLMMTITATIAGAISMLASSACSSAATATTTTAPASSARSPDDPGAAAAMLVQMAISRTREYAADNLGARICGQPMWLASALTRSPMPRIIPTRKPSAIPRRRTCSSSIRCRARAWTICSRRILDREPHRRVAAARRENRRGRRNAFHQCPRQHSAPRPMGPTLGLARTVGMMRSEGWQRRVRAVTTIYPRASFEMVPTLRLAHTTASPSSPSPLPPPLPSVTEPTLRPAGWHNNIRDRSRRPPPDFDVAHPGFVHTNLKTPYSRHRSQNNPPYDTTTPCS